MPSSTNHQFNSDRPIESAEQDKLERSGFADQLATRISAWRGQESLVIGLYGDWGSGKSSVKNLIVEKLSKQADEAPVVVQFNPWVVSGEEKITRAFFNEVGSKLEHHHKDPAAKARAASWRKYARALQTASQLAGTFDLISPAFGIVAPGAGAWASKRIKQAKDMAETAAGSLETQPVSLEETKRELRTHFKSLSKPLLVVIDDIDRLTSEEICLVFRLVKANADFPNTIYLLLFQRQTAEKALDDISKGKGREFLEKIVQVGFDLPAPSRSALHQVLFKHLDQVLDPLLQPGEWDSARWVDLWMGSLSRYFTNMREIYRFLNSFTFMLSALQCEGTLEVNAVDLVCVECLRVFEPAVYAEVRENKSLLTERHGDRAHKECEALANRLLEVPSSDKDNVKGALTALFPELRSCWSNCGYSDEFYRVWKTQRRVCSPDFFDRYFILQLPKGQISEFTVRSILAARGDRSALRQILEGLEERGLLLVALERMEAERLLDESKNPLPYLLSLCDMSDRLPQTSVAGIRSPGSLLVRYAVNRVLGETTGVTRKTEIISSLITDADCLGLPAQWLDDVTDPKEDSIYPRIEGEALSALKSCWLLRVRAFAQQGRLADVVNLRWVLPLWMQWADPSEAKEWVSSLLANPKRTLAFLNAYVNESTSQTVGSFFVQDKSWLSWKSLERFQPKEKWDKAASGLSGLQDLSDQEKRTLELFIAAMRRWQKGIDDSDPRMIEDSEEVQHED